MTEDSKGDAEIRRYVGTRKKVFQKLSTKRHENIAGNKENNVELPNIKILAANAGRFPHTL